MCLIFIDQIFSSVLTKPKNRILNYENQKKDIRKSDDIPSRRIEEPERSLRRSVVKRKERKTEDEETVDSEEQYESQAEDWTEQDDFGEESELWEHSKSNAGTFGHSVSERRKKEELDRIHFPQNPEQFENRQEFILAIIDKLNQALKTQEHVLQIEVDRNDIQDTLYLLEGYKELRDYNQNLAVDSIDEEDEDLDYEAYGDNEEGDNTEGNEEDELFEGDDNEDNLHIEDEAGKIAHGEEHLTGEGENGEENWEALEENLEEQEHPHTETETDVLNHHDEENNHVNNTLEKTEEHHELHKEEVSEENENENEHEMNYDKLPDLLVVVEGIMKTFNNLFSDFPKEPNAQNQEEREKQLEHTYDQLNEFIEEVYTKKETIDSEMEYLIDHVDAIKFTRLDVLDFYHYKSLFEEIENNVLEDNDDWNSKVKILDIEVSEFVSHVKDISRSLNNAESAQLIIWNETEFIKKQLESEKALSINEKISGLPSLIQKMLNVKFDIDLFLNQISLKLKLVRNQKKQFKTTLVDMQVYTGVDGLGGSLRKSNQYILSIAISMFALMLAFFKTD